MLVKFIHDIFYTISLIMTPLCIERVERYKAILGF